MADDIGEAIEHYERALEREPNAVPVHKRLAECYIQKNNYTRATDVLQNALLLDPDNIDTYTALFSVYMKQRKYSSALACLTTISRMRYASASSKPDFGIDDFERLQKESDSDYALFRRLREKIRARDESLCAILAR